MAVLCPSRQPSLYVLHELFVIRSCEPLVLHILDHYVLLVQRSDFIEYPPRLVRGANVIAVTREDGHWHMSYILDGYVGLESESLVFRVVLCVLLESVLDAILEEVVHRPRRERLGSPADVLRAPVDGEVHAHERSYLVPVRPVKDREVEQLAHVADLRVEGVPALALGDMHLRARSEKDDPANIV